MVGDRYMTDIVFGNRLGMMTIRPAPLTWDGEPSTVKMVISACSKAAPVIMARPACMLLLSHAASSAFPVYPEQMLGTVGGALRLYPAHCSQSRRIEERYVRQWTQRGILVSCATAADTADLLLSHQ